jgi:hypothetical protein
MRLRAEKYHRRRSHRRGDHVATRWTATARTLATGAVATTTLDATTGRNVHRPPSQSWAMPAETSISTDQTNPIATNPSRNFIQSISVSNQRKNAHTATHDASATNTVKIISKKVKLMRPPYRSMATNS